MKQKEPDVFQLILKLQEQISSLDKKMDLIMGRVMATPVLMSQQPPQAPKPVNINKGPFKIICVQCGKEDFLPFRPAEGRAVYCKECFRNKRSGGPVRAEDNYPKVVTEEPKVSEVAPKKKPAAVKKTVTKKKTVPKKK